MQTIIAGQELISFKIVNGQCLTRNWIVAETTPDGYFNLVGDGLEQCWYSMEGGHCNCLEQVSGIADMPTKLYIAGVGGSFDKARAFHYDLHDLKQFQDTVVEGVKNLRLRDFNKFVEIA